jgi:hypothetical protein
MMSDPAFYALFIGFVLVIYGFTPLSDSRLCCVSTKGFIAILFGLAIVATVTAVKALS